MNESQLMTQTAVASWNLNIDRLDKMFASLSDDDLQKEIAPGKNRIYYLLGHLAAVHDRLLPMLGIGERLHEELDEPFLVQPDRAQPDTTPPADLRRAWSDVNARLASGFAAMQPEDWLKRHSAVSEEDFAKEPLRNRLAVLLSRASHAGFHAGQIVLVRERQ